MATTKIQNYRKADRTTINCTRCHQCRLLPETDMAATTPVVWCGRKQERTILILSGCGLANNTTTRQGGGDRTVRPSAVEKAFILARGPKLTMTAMRRHTARGDSALYGIYRRLGIKGPGFIPASAAISRARKQAKGTAFNQAQTAYIVERRASGDWPRGDGCKVAGNPWQVKQAALRDEIVAGVAALGRARSWVSIHQHLYHQTAASYRLKIDPARRERQRARRAAQ